MVKRYINMDKRDFHFLKYRLYGIQYLRFYKNLKKLGIEFLTDHSEEFYYLKRYQEYGLEYLNFLNDAINLNIDEIVDMKNNREIRNTCILKWVLMNLNGEGRNKNN